MDLSADMAVDVEVNPTPLLLDTELALTLSNLTVIEDTCGVSRVEDSMDLMVENYYPMWLLRLRSPIGWMEINI